MTAESISDHRNSELFRRIEERRDEVAALTASLIAIPTVNPPGDAYEPCARFLGDRLAARGFTVEYLRAEGAVGDSDRYPRLNIVARIEGSEPGPCVHFNSHIDVVAPGASGSEQRIKTPLLAGSSTQNSSVNRKSEYDSSLIRCPPCEGPRRPGPAGACSFTAPNPS